MSIKRTYYNDGHARGIDFEVYVLTHIDALTEQYERDFGMLPHAAHDLAVHVFGMRLAKTAIKEQHRLLVA